MTPDTVTTVSPNKPKTPLHSFRYGKDEWKELQAAVAKNGETVTDVIVRALDAYRAENPPIRSA